MIYPVCKRLFDILASLVGLLVLSPVIGVIAVLIYLQSPGPIFYHGLRTGLHGQPFYTTKFRTMVVNAEQVGGTTTGKNDPRVTPIGRFLRKYKLDELPQLFDVFRGKMSLVGPRPEVQEYTDLYTAAELPILSVRPGITDFSSIELISLDELVGEQDADHTFRNEVLPLKNQLRLKYIEERSFGVDIMLIFRTLVRIANK